jgi:ABC transporter substrate binding protein (PQQ-dependent alcohol dehydrogenase system)
MNRWLLRLFWFGLYLLGAAAHAANWNIALIELADDPQLDRTRLERAYLGHPGGSALDGINVALDDAQFELDAEKMTVKVKTQTAATLEAARAMAQQAEKSGAVMVLLNLPDAWVSAIALSVKTPVLNLSSSSDALRERDCVANLYHLLPSDRMRADAVAQALVARKWVQVLVLQGASAQDATRGAVALAAMKRYGLKTVAIKPFKLSADPRERTMANLNLLTANLSFDVIWAIDTDGEFARTLPYSTTLPRPVVGDSGLVALAHLRCRAVLPKQPKGP